MCLLMYMYRFEMCCYQILRFTCLNGWIFFQNGLLPTCENIQNSLCVMNGDLMEPDCSLDALMPSGGGQQQGKKTKAKSSGTVKLAQCSVKLLYNNVSVENSQTFSLSFEC